MGTTESWNHRIIQVGRNVRRFLIQPLAQSRLLRDLSRRVLKTSKEVPLATSSIAGLLSWWISYSLYFILTSFISTCGHCPSSSHHVPLWRAWLCLFSNLPISTGRLLLVAPEATSAQAEQSQLPPLLLTGEPPPSWCCSLNSLQFIQIPILPLMEVQNWMQYSRCDLTSGTIQCDSWIQLR